MPQELATVYDTIYQTGQGNNNVVITLQPSSVTPNTVESELNTVIGLVVGNNVPVLEGELLLYLKNTLKNIDFEINENGELIINAPDADNYSIDANGYLIYTYR
jgi:hypothetical protein